MSLIRRICLVLMLGVVLPAVAGETAAERVDAELDRRAADGRFSGAVLVAKDGDVIFSAARGLADLERKVPNSLDTKFRFGSLGKMFTAVAIAQLEQAGKVSFDAPLGTYLRDYPDPATAKVTLHQLLTHTGGTGDVFGPEFRSTRLALKTLRDYVDLYGARPPEFPPGSEHRYSNYGFILLGRVIEVVSGQAYDAYVRDHVFLPAGMTSTGNEPETAHVAGLALPYLGEPDAPRSAVDTLPFRGTSAGGGYTTVGDLSKFAQALLGGKLLDARHTELLTAGKVDTPMPGLRYGYGFEDMHLRNGLHRIGHGGGAPGMNAAFSIFPETGHVSIVLSNRDPPSAMEIERLLVDTFLVSR
ncbi:MAG TPA: serine hydrolase domain-containing protein [Steroidobacteraceae bacterium]|nr:serine hydrolase domain-containing protein [Steroidobacteraceae bacterium]